MNNTAFTVVLGLLTLGQTMPSVPSISLAETAQGPEAMLFSTVGFQSGVIDVVQGASIRIARDRADHSHFARQVSSERGPHRQDGGHVAAIAHERTCLNL